MCVCGVEAGSGQSATWSGSFGASSDSICEMRARPPPQASARVAYCSEDGSFVCFQAIQLYDTRVAVAPFYDRLGTEDDARANRHR